MFRAKVSWFQVLLGAELIALLLLLPGCFRGEELFFELNLKEEAWQAFDGGFQCQEVWSKELPPGVYQVRVRSSLTENQSVSVDVWGEASYFNSFRGNRTAIYPGQDSVDFEFYVVDKVPAACVNCEFYGSAPLALECLEIYRTNRGVHMLFVLSLVFFGVLDALLIWRRRILDGGAAGERIAVFWGLAGIILVAYFPYLSNYYIAGTETDFQLLRIEALKTSILNGHFPLMGGVQDYWLYDHGYAAAFFRGNLFLLLPVLMRLIGFPLSSAYKAFLFVTIAATAALSYLSVSKCLKDRYAALAGAAVYTLVPYRIFFLYGRGAIEECMAMAFMPLVCCGLYLLVTEDEDGQNYRTYKWYLIVGMSAILHSSVFLFLVTAGCVLFICVLFWKRILRKKTLSQVFEAAGSILLLNCGFLAPMLYMAGSDSFRLRELVHSGMQDWKFGLAESVQLLSQKGGERIGMYGAAPIQIGAATIAVVLGYLGFLLWQKKKSRKIERILLGFLALDLILSLRLPFLLVPGAVIGALFTAFVCRRLREEGGSCLYKTGLAVILIVTVGSAVYQVNDIAFESLPVYLYTAQSMGTVSVMSGEYLIDGAAPADIYPHGPVADAGVQLRDYEKKGTEVKLSVKNLTDGVGYLELPLLGYKGYEVKVLEGVGSPSIAEERGHHGDLRLAIPGGFEGTVKIWYKGFILFRVAKAVSAVSFLALLAYAVYRGKCIFANHKK